MKRPMLWFTAFYVAGVLLGQYSSSGIVFFWVAFAAVAAHMYFFKKYALIAALCIVLGYVNMIRLHPDYKYDGKNVEITGRIADATGNMVTISTETIAIDDELFDEKMRIAFYSHDTTYIQPGLAVTVKCALKAPGDERIVYFRKYKIMYSAYGEILSAGDIKITAHVLIRMLREALAKVYDSTLPEKEAAIVKSMIIGDKDELSDEIKNIYQIAGIFHILAISGLHVTVLSLAVNKVVSKLPLSKKAQYASNISFLLFYCIFTGAGIATVRATIMSIVVIAGDMLGRDNDTLSAVSVAALGILLYEPYFLWDAGFQYSFVTVICLVVCSEAVERALTRLAGHIPALNMVFTQNYVRKYLAGCITGSVASLPISAWHFEMIPLYSVISNLFIAGSVFFTVLLGFLTGIIGSASISAGTFCAGGLYVLLWLYERLCLFISELPYADIRVERTNLFFVFCYYLTIFMFTYIFRGKGNL